MMELPFTQVDAFADRPFTGNPAAVMPLEAWLPDTVLQAIALENNLSETAFTVPCTDGEADYELRWFTPTVEVALCGHASLAAGHVLIGAHDGVRLRTRKAGVLTVARDGDALTLDLPGTGVKPASHDALLAALGTPTAEAFLSVGGAEDTAIVLLSDEAAVRAVAPEMRVLGAIEVMAIVTAPGSGGIDAVSRVFVPAWGIDEDPVTGSAHAALTPFWAERLGKERVSFHQASARGGDLTGRVDGDRVILSGRCVTVIEGKFRF